MENKLNYLQAINFINLLHTQQANETQKIRQNPEKGGREYLRRILDA